MSARVHDTGKRVALGAGATCVHWLGDTAVFALGDGALVNARLDGAAIRREVHDGPILCAALHPGGERLLTGGDDGALRLTGAEGEAQTVASFAGKWIEHLAASAASGVIVAGIGKEVIVFKDERESHRFAYASSIGGLALDAKGRRLAASHYGGATLRYVLMAGDKGAACLWVGSHLAVTLSPDADYLVTGMQENELHGWRLPEKTDLRMTGYTAKTRSFSWNKAGRLLATSGADCAVTWPFVGKLGPQGKAPLLLAPREALVTAVAFHPSEDILAIGYGDGAALAVRLSDQIIIELDEPGEGPVTALCWRRDGLALAIGDEAGRGAIVSLG